MPGLTGAVPFSSIQPLKTQPKPPSPRRLSGLKFRVANLRSLNVNFRSREATFSSSSSLEVEELLSALLVVVDEITAAAGWSLLVSFVDLLSADPQNRYYNLECKSCEFIIHWLITIFKLRKKEVSKSILTNQFAIHWTICQIGLQTTINKTDFNNCFLLLGPRFNSLQEPTWQIATNFLGSQIVGLVRSTKSLNQT